MSKFCLSPQVIPQNKQHFHSYEYMLFCHHKSFPTPKKDFHSYECCFVSSHTQSTKKITELPLIWVQFGATPYPVHKIYQVSYSYDPCGYYFAYSYYRFVLKIVQAFFLANHGFHHCHMGLLFPAPRFWIGMFQNSDSAIYVLIEK